jgi:hypothetical protein
MAMSLLLFLVSFAVAGCSYVSPDAGHEAVLVRKPLLFGSGGIDPTPIKAGKTKYIAWTTDAIIVDMRPQQTEIEFKDAMTSTGVPVEFHSAMQWQFTDSVKAVSGFGVDEQFFVRNIEQKYRMSVRDSVKKKSLIAIAIDASAAEEVDAEVKTATLAIIKESGLPIGLLGVTLGKANPPDAVKTQRIATAEQQQRQETEKQGKLAEDQRKFHEESRADADNAYLKKMGMSSEQFIQLRQIETIKQVCAWERGNCTFINGNPTGTMFTIK